MRMQPTCKAPADSLPACALLLCLRSSSKTGLILDFFLATLLATLLSCSELASLQQLLPRLLLCSFPAEILLLRVRLFTSLLCFAFLTFPCWLACACTLLLAVLMCLLDMTCHMVWTFISQLEQPCEMQQKSLRCFDMQIFFSALSSPRRSGLKIMLVNPCLAT